ncbi:MAG: septum formation family protein [Acidimicrobiia bacterium]|nr:septum formation family protein [Acidimicrobiia bacterium]
MMRRVFALTLTTTVLVAVSCGNSSSADQTTRDSAGQIVGGGDLGAFTIKVGDCLAGGVTGEIESVDGVPCEEPHQSEVYYSFAIPEGDGTFPGTEAVQDRADESCLGAFQGFVGIDFETSIYEISTITPTAESWAQLDDREVLCLIGQAEGTLSTGTAKGTAK